MLGSGQFGTVYEGVWKQSPTQSVSVAAKTLKEDARAMDRIKFLQEAATMAQFKHPNVIFFYGIAKKDKKVKEFWRLFAYFGAV